MIILFIEIFLKKRRATKICSILYLVLGLFYSGYKIFIACFFLYENYSINIAIAVIAGVNVLVRILCFLSLQFYTSELNKREMFELRKKQEAFIEHLSNNTQDSLV